MKENKTNSTTMVEPVSSKVQNNKGTLTVPFTILSILFVVCLIVSNLIEIKTVDLGWFTITGGFIVFPVSYIINDCVVEVYGFAKARFMIWIGFAMNVLTAIFLNLAVILPGSPDWTSQSAMEAIYCSVPRIMVASFAAFIGGSMVNAYVMSRMKVAATNHNSRRSFSIRAIISTLWGEGVDSLIFFPIAFGGVLSWSTILSLMLTQALLKTGYEVCVLPITLHVVRRLKTMENLDVVDTDVDYRWWRCGKIC